jgi:hypothetical protein
MKKKNNIIDLSNIAAQSHHLTLVLQELDFANFPIDFTDLDQMRDIQARYRSRLKSMVMSYRLWKQSYADEMDELERVYTAYEGIFMRRQLNDCWRLYLAVNRDYHAMCRALLALYCHYPHKRFAS